MTIEKISTIENNRILLTVSSHINETVINSNEKIKKITDEISKLGGGLIFESGVFCIEVLNDIDNGDFQKIKELTDNLNLIINKIQESGNNGAVEKIIS